MAGHAEWTVGLLFLFSALSHVRCDSYCSEGWTYHQGSCYIFKHESYNWFDAQSECRYLGGYLAEDESEAEHQFLAQMARAHDTHIWLGFQDFAVEGTFVSTWSREPVNKTFWAPGEPEDRDDEEDCVGMDQDGGGWFDGNCEDKKTAFVCEISDIEEPIIG